MKYYRWSLPLCVLCSTSVVLFPTMALRLCTYVLWTWTSANQDDQKWWEVRYQLKSYHWALNNYLPESLKSHPETEGEWSVTTPTSQPKCYPKPISLPMFRPNNSPVSSFFFHSWFPVPVAQIPFSQWKSSKYRIPFCPLASNPSLKAIQWVGQTGSGTVNLQILG